MKYLILAIALILGGCISAPVVYKATPNTVMIQGITQIHTGQGFDMAEIECQKFNKHAVPIRTSDFIMTYHCEY